MKQEEVLGDILRKSIPVSSAPLSELIDKAEMSLSNAEKDPALFSAFIILSLPKSYLNRENRRVDICGTVDSSTKEYADGYRYFSSNALFFFEDGTSTFGMESPYDLLSIIDDFDLPYTTKPLSLSTWVHPRHYSEASFFESLERSQEPVKVSGYYLNRMGFVVEITHQYDNIMAQQKGLDLHDTGDIFVDAGGQTYLKTGAIAADTKSMGDLVYEIISWDLFGRTDWSQEVLYDTSKETPGKNSPPELFNPIGESAAEKRQKLFDCIIQAKSLAKDLNIVLGFHMQDNAGLSV